MNNKVIFKISIFFDEKFLKAIFYILNIILFKIFDRTLLFF